MPNSEASNAVQGVVWLVFPGVHHIGWWEQHYLRALSSYLAQTIRADGLRLAVNAFAHHVLEPVNAAVVAANNLKTPAGEAPGRFIQTIELVLRLLESKALEVKLLLAEGREAAAKTEKDIDAAQETETSGLPPVEIKRAIDDARALSQLHHPSKDYSEPDTTFVEPATAHTEVDGMLFPAALNLLGNAFSHAKGPYCVLACAEEGGLIRVYFADGGPKPKGRRASGTGTGLKFISRMAALTGTPFDQIDLPPELAKRGCGQAFAISLKKNPAGELP